MSEKHEIKGLIFLLDNFVEKVLFFFHYKAVSSGLQWTYIAWEHLAVVLKRGTGLGV